MIRFWSDKSNGGWLRGMGMVLLACLVFSIIAPPLAEANLWDERRKALEEAQKKTESARDALRRPRPGPKTMLAQKFDLPEAYGTVVESWSGARDLEA